tara:strand:- start:15 stop:965 length:951 start_codon:yes stop_codon:yes gene_type:complete
MKQKNCLIWGASGQIGRNLIRKLTKDNFRVTAVTRNTHKNGYILKTQANPGFIDIVEANIFDIEKINRLTQEAQVVINLIGILHQNNKLNSFENIHVKFPYILSKYCKQNNVEQLIHLSALGVEKVQDSDYAKSKLNGENAIKKNFENTTILRPSVVFSVDDKFTTKFMTMLNLLPFFPLYYKGQTKFQPIFCSDLTNIISEIIKKKIFSETIECAGPEILTFENIIKELLKLINKKRLLISLPNFIGKYSSIFLEYFPKPIITLDQFKILKYDNILSNKYKNQKDFNLDSTSYFVKEVEKYAHMWRDGGEFSKKI